MKHSYDFQTTNRRSAQLRAEQLMEQGAQATLLSIGLDEPSTLEALSQVDHIFADADGTIVDEGTEAFLPDKIELFKQLAKFGIGITVVTGKPLAEAAPLRQSLPAEVPLNIICEKGAYDVHFDATGAWREFILSSAEQEQTVAELREKFMDFSKQLIATYGSDKLGFGWGGSGEHKSALSIDLFAGQPPKDYLKLRGKDRDAIKLQDPTLIQKVEKDIADWAHQHQPAWRVIHVGNANTEINPGTISKSEAIVESAEFGAARKVLLLGDSPLDKEMFSLRDKFMGKAITGLVLHRKASLPLVAMADFVAFGMANSNPILQAVIDNKSNDHIIN